MELKTWSALAFTEEEIELIFTKMEYTKIRQVCNEIEDEASGQRQIKRDVYVRWLLDTETNKWLFDKIWDLVQLSNTSLFNYSLAGPPKEIQFSHYLKNHFHDWHTDAGEGLHKKEY